MSDGPDTLPPCAGAHKIVAFRICGFVFVCDRIEPTGALRRA
jgi:hypothetical protein